MKYDFLFSKCLALYELIGCKNPFQIYILRFDLKDKQIQGKYKKNDMLHLYNGIGRYFYDNDHSP